MKPSRTDGTRQSGTAHHVSVAVVGDAGMADIGHCESAGQSHHHIHGKRGGNPATRGWATASLETAQWELRELMDLRREINRMYQESNNGLRGGKP